MPSNPANSEAGNLFEEAMTWLRSNYGEFSFHVERDLVWTLQTWLVKTIKDRRLTYKVFHDYPILPGSRRSLSADLAILDGPDVEVAAELKYEPAHAREDIQRQQVATSLLGNRSQRERDGGCS